MKGGVGSEADMAERASRIQDLEAKLLVELTLDGMQ